MQSLYGVLCNTSGRPCYCCNHPEVLKPSLRRASKDLSISEVGLLDRKHTLTDVTGVQPLHLAPECQVRKDFALPFDLL